MNPFVFRNLSYGVYVVSTVDNGVKKYTGCIANSVMQVTSAPATVAVSINHDNYTNKCIKESGIFAVSILGEKTRPKIIGTLGFRSGRDTDTFAQVSYEEIGGLPVIDKANGYILCKVENIMEAATHTVFLGTVVDGDILSDEPSMTYAYNHKVINDKSPKNAPTYIEQADGIKATAKRVVYKCTVCGYIYEGETPFEDLPDDYKCPVCGAGKDKFIKLEV